MNYRHAQNLKKISCEELVIEVRLRSRRRSFRYYDKCSNGQHSNNHHTACQPAIDLERSMLLIWCWTNTVNQNCWKWVSCRTSNEHVHIHWWYLPDIASRWSEQICDRYFIEIKRRRRPLSFQRDGEETEKTVLYSPTKKSIRRRRCCFFRWELGHS